MIGIWTPCHVAVQHISHYYVHVDVAHFVTDLTMVCFLCLMSYQLSFQSHPYRRILIVIFKKKKKCSNQRGDISILNVSSLKLVDKFTYLGSSVSSTETDINKRLAKAWTAIDRLSVIWKSDLTDKMKRSFFQSAAVLILQYECTTWTLTKCMEKKLDSNYARMLRAILKKSWRQHSIKQQLYGHLPPITKTIKVRQTRHAGHCWRRMNS